MEADGVKLSASDIIRLNAIGLKLERNPYAAESLFYLPRIAYLGDVVLRQPTMGHEIWLDDVARTVDMADPMTNLAITAYACSVANPDDLPPADSRLKITSAMVAFRWKVRKFTVAQILAATKYVCEGNDDTAQEYPASKADD